MTTAQSQHRTTHRSAGERFQETMSDAAQSVQDIGGSAKEFAQEKLEQASRQVGHYYEQSQAKAQELKHSLESAIRNQPLKSMLIAAGIGLIVGGLALRR